jgi:transposase
MEQRQYVGIDLHRRRTVIVRMDAAGGVLGEVGIDNDPRALAAEMAQAGEAPEVVLEAAYGWYWAVDVLEALGCRVHLAHPLGIKAFEIRRVKNDRLDARLLADLLRPGAPSRGLDRSPAHPGAARARPLPPQAGR